MDGSELTAHGVGSLFGGGLGAYVISLFAKRWMQENDARFNSIVERLDTLIAAHGDSKTEIAVLRSELSAMRSRVDRHDLILERRKGGR